MISTKQGIDWIVERLRQDQSPDGSWNYPFETGLSTDAYTIILLRTLEIDDEELIQGLAERILSRQQENGSWKLYYDEPEGNLTATIDCYYALLFTGLFPKNDPRLQAAKKFILAKGGLEDAGIYTKVMLALTGQYKWPSFTPFPIEMILLPDSFPVNLYSFSIFGRANMVPIMILSDRKITFKTATTPNISDLHLHRSDVDPWVRTEEHRSLLSLLEEGIGLLIGLPKELHSLALERAKKYMLSRIEPDGTFVSYYSCTFLMIFALLSLGYKKTDSIIVNAVNGIKSMQSSIDGYPHMQYTTANVWNTSLIGFTLQAAGVPSEDPMVEKANEYLLKRQHHKFGDWVVHNPHTLPGGWGFSDINTIVPDVDDTTAALRSISRIASNHFQAWDRALDWLFSMQNNDGGWPAFETETQSNLLKLLPLEKAEFLLMDPSCADLTGRTLEFLGNFTNLSRNHDAVKKGIHWLRKNQENDGSWYGRWGICYLYGTWGAVTGLMAAGVPANDGMILKAIHFLKNTQNKDGGWGESCRSDIQKAYVPLAASTLVHTSWALDALITVADKPTPAIQKGIAFLLENLDKRDWRHDYPKGQGMGGAFYIHYHSYRYIFPLMALSHYERKYG